VLGFLFLVSRIRIVFIFCIALLFCRESFAQDTLAGHAVERDSLRLYRIGTVEVLGDRSLTQPIHTTTARTETADHLSALTATTSLALAAKALSSSLEIRRYGTPGSVSFTSFRGLPPEYTTVYRDGIRVTNDQNSLTDFARIGLHSVATIELLPSESAMELGGDAIGASLNLVTKMPTRSGISIGSAVTSYDDLKGFVEQEYFANANLAIGDDLKIGIAGAADNSLGRFPFYQSSTGTTVYRSNNDGTLRDLNLTGAYTLSGQSQLSLVAQFTKAERGVPGAATIDYVGASSPNARQADEDLYSALQFNTLLGLTGRWNLHVGYQSQFETYIDPRIPISDHYLNRIYQIGSRYTTALSPILSMHSGVEYTRSYLFSNENSFSKMDSAIARDHAEIFLGGKLLPWDGLQTAIAVRTEVVSHEPTRVLPQASVDYTLLPGVLSIGGSYALTYHAPTFNALYWRGYGNPNVHPEHGTNAEATVKWTPAPIIGILTGMRVTGFAAAIDDEIIWQPGASGNFSPVNIQKVLSRGVEMEWTAAGKITDELSFSVREAYTILSSLNKTQDTDIFNKEIPYSTPTASVFTGELHWKERLAFAVLMNYRGHRFGDAGNLPTDRLPPITTIDLTASLLELLITSTTTATFRIGIENITNEQYSEVPNFPLPGRTVRASMTLELFKQENSN
jgi:vitamin B12 transporter